MQKKLIVEIISAILVLLFLYACGSKWVDFKTFYHDMNNQPFPNQLTPWLVWTIPFLELGIAVGLGFERTRLKALYVSLGFLILYTVYVAAVLLHAFDYIPCSCGGIIRMLSWPQHLVFNLFFIGLTMAGIVFSRRSRSM